MAVAPGNVSSAAANTNSLAWAHTLAVGSNLVMVGLALDAGVTASGVTYGVTAMLLLRRDTNVGSGESEIWYLEGQTTSETITATLTAKDRTIGGAVDFSAAGTPDNATGSNANGVTSVSDTVSGVGADDFVFDVLRKDIGAPTVGADQTEQWNIASAGERGSGSTQDGVDGGAMSWSWVGGSDIAHTACRIPSGDAVLAVGIAAEVDAAQPITAVGGAVTSAVGLASELDSALPVVVVPGALSIATGLVAETDSAFPVVAVGGAASVVVGQAEETGTAQPIVAVGGPVTVLVDQAAEVDAALPVTRVAGAVSVAIGIALETDAAQPITVIAGATAVPLGQAEEVDTARTIVPLGGGVSVAVGQASELDSASPVAAVAGAVSVAVGTASEVDEAQPVAVLVGSSGSVVAQAVQGGGPLLQSEAQVITPVAGGVTVAVGLVAEVDSVRPIGALTLLICEFFSTTEGTVDLGSEASPSVDYSSEVVC